MNEDLANEIEALNSIYGDDTLVATDSPSIYILNLPQNNTSLRIEFPSDYPNAPPAVLGVNSSGEHAKRGDANHLLNEFRNTIGRLFQPGEVCLYDVIEDITTNLPTSLDSQQQASDPAEDLQPDVSQPSPEDEQEPPWTLSDPIIEKGSIFIARCAPCTSPAQAQTYLSHLLRTDKRVSKATHNITAHRIRCPPPSSDSSHSATSVVTYQDCNDDGESAAGGRLLHLLQLMDLWNVCVVVTRWYGGQKLGPARFGIINGVARDALVKGGFVDGEAGGGGKKKGGKK